MTTERAFDPRGNRCDMRHDKARCVGPAWGVLATKDVLMWLCARHMAEYVVGQTGWGFTNDAAYREAIGAYREKMRVEDRKGGR